MKNKRHISTVLVLIVTAYIVSGCIAIPTEVGLPILPWAGFTPILSEATSDGFDFSTATGIDRKSVV